MNKNDFLAKLCLGLLGLPEEDIEERIAFYGEMIDDRIEEGATEAEAVADIGSPEEIARQTIEEYPLARLVKKKMKPKRRLCAWEIVLLVLGSPVWLPLLISAFAVVFALYVVLWAVIICLWATFASFVGAASGGIASGIIFIIEGNVLSGAAMIGAGIFLAGLAIFVFFGCRAATKGIILLTKKLARSIKNCFIRGRK